MKRIALKLAYLGWRFHGLAPQPGLRTVAGDIKNVLDELGVEWQGLRWASRTDKGVSALGNVLALDLAHDTPQKLLPALNARLTDIWFYGYKFVSQEFSPRKALVRWYRYLQRKDEDYDGKLLEKASELFVGTHDFANFVKGAKGNTIHNIYAVDLSRTRHLIVFDFFGESFGWQLVRRLVGAILDVGRGTHTLENLGDALANAGTQKYNFSVAPSENLILMDVNYGFEFDREERAVRMLKKSLALLSARAELHSAFLAMLRKRIAL